eukprot:TRINITY_DN1987_c0_g1_i2.p1 TRINITY_DN1987_c0_g1~~TRINITY_DN1987_c0_g1_i2.p1  ORF type:complete len:183 (-),score=12.27 TRINITY_DN1987_c0_g1_i2:273-800(-)
MSHFLKRCNNEINKFELNNPKQIYDVIFKLRLNYNDERNARVTIADYLKIKDIFKTSDILIMEDEKKYQEFNDCYNIKNLIDYGSDIENLFCQLNYISKRKMIVVNSDSNLQIILNSFVKLNNNTNITFYDVYRRCFCGLDMICFGSQETIRTLYNYDRNSQINYDDYFVCDRLP